MPVLSKNSFPFDHELTAQTCTRVGCTDTGGLCILPVALAWTQARGTAYLFPMLYKTRSTPPTSVTLFPRLQHVSRFFFLALDRLID